MCSPSPTTPTPCTPAARRGPTLTTLKGVFAYPFGAVGPGALAGLRREGFHLAFTTEPGSNDADTDPLHLKRNLVPRDAGLDEFAKILAR